MGHAGGAARKTPEPDDGHRADSARVEMSDAVDSPAHYVKGGIECIDAVDAAISDLDGPEAHYTASAIQYLWRWKSKGGVEDLQKARWYLNRLIQAASIG